MRGRWYFIDYMLGKAVKSAIHAWMQSTVLLLCLHHGTSPGLAVHALQGARKIDFAAFERALPLLAKEKGIAPEEVRRAIVLSGGPSRNTSVTPDFVRLHDDKTTFTGE